MKKLSVLLLVFMATACGNDDVIEVDSAASLNQGALVGGFEFDTSALELRPSGVLPANPVKRDAFSDTALKSKLLQSSEEFEITGKLKERNFFESKNWYLENDPSQGLVLALRTPRKVVDAPQNPQRLKKASMKLLRKFGIFKDATSRILQRKSLLQSEDDSNGVLMPEIHRYKTFVLRGVEGVAVLGHRAVVTHHRDGSFQRAFIKWPALASAGHRLTSAVSVTDITERAASQLQQEQAHEGPVSLSWIYVPALSDNGEVVLTLKAEARVAAFELEDGHVEESRRFLVDIDAQ